MPKPQFNRRLSPEALAHLAAIHDITGSTATACVEQALAHYHKEIAMPPQISVKTAYDVDATNAYAVTVTNEYGETTTVTVHTNEAGEGLWIDGKQVEGALQFHAGKNPAAAIRRYFQSIHKD